MRSFPREFLREFLPGPKRPARRGNLLEHLGAHFLQAGLDHFGQFHSPGRDIFWFDPHHHRAGSISDYFSKSKRFHEIQLVKRILDGHAFFKILHGKAVECSWGMTVSHAIHDNEMVSLADRVEESQAQGAAIK